MIRVLSVLALALSTLSTSVVAFSTMPGACRLSGMKTGANNPHGFAPSTDMTYTLSVQPSSAVNSYTVTLSGSGTFTGLLIFAQDSLNGTRFGSFSSVPSGYALLTTCGDINPASNTLGHNSATPKNLPVSFEWNAAGYPAPFSGIFSAIVMSATETMWYTPTGVLFSSTGNAAPMASSMTSSMMASATTSSMMASDTMMSSAAASAGGSSMSMSMSNDTMMMSTTSGSMAMETNTMMMSGSMTGSGAASMPSSMSSTMTMSSSGRVSVSLLLGLLVPATMIALSL